MASQLGQHTRFSAGHIPDPSCTYPLLWQKRIHETKTEWSELGILSFCCGAIGLSLVCALTHRETDLINRLSLLGFGGSSLSIKAAGKGTPLVMVHGFPLNNSLWDAQLKFFSRTHHVIAPDLVGFGASSQEPELIEGIGIGDFARDLELIRSHLAPDEQIVLCGLSMGGYIALDYWARHPEHLKGLVLVNTKPGLDSAEAKNGRFAMAKSATAGEPVLKNMYEKLLSQNTVQQSSAACKATMDMIDSTPLTTVAAAQQAMAARTDFSDRLVNVQVPTLVVAGEEDPLAPVASTNEWASKLPNAKLAILPGCGHLTPLESPDGFNEALNDFLVNLPCSGS